MKTITINSISYSLVTMPASPGPADIEIGMSDLVALQMSPYTMQQQTQQWPFADLWDAKVTLPPMTTAGAAPWEAFLAALRGSLNVFQLADPRHVKPLGSALGIPKIDSGTYAVSTSTIGTTGWQANQARALLPGARFQLGYRLYMVMDDAPVSADEHGNATISIWPSLREQPAAGEALVLKCPKGLFRLSAAGARRMLSASPRQLTRIGSIPCIEVR